MSSPVEALDPLTLHRYRARFRLRRPLELSAESLGVVLRGAFGLTLRRLVCHDLSLACAACPLRSTCAYPAVFDPGARDDRTAIARIADPPRPFVVRPSAIHGEGVPRDGEFGMDLHVVGAAQAEAPLLLTALQRLADEGIGPGRVGLLLEHIEVLDARGTPCSRALDPREARLTPAAPALRARDLVRPGDPIARCVRIRYVTPTFLREAGAPMTEPAFGPLLRRLRARLGAFSTVYGEAPIGDDPREVGALADRVALVRSDVRWRETERRSTRTGQRHPLGGFVGEALYEGDLGPFLPMLRLAELLHVGKHATFGLGRVEVEVLG
jgi:hypothetical protein